MNEILMPRIKSHEAKIKYRAKSRVQTSGWDHFFFFFIHSFAWNSFRANVRAHTRTHIYIYIIHSKQFCSNSAKGRQNSQSNLRMVISGEVSFIRSRNSTMAINTTRNLISIHLAQPKYPKFCCPHGYSPHGETRERKMADVYISFLSSSFFLFQGIRNKESSLSRVVQKIYQEIVIV